MISRAWFAMALCLSAACGHKEPAVERFAVIRDSLASAPADESGSARRVFLNEEIRIYFEGQVDPLSVTPDTVRLRDVLDGRLVRGRLMVATRSVTFVPVPPCNPELDDGSLKPGRRYRLEVTGFPSTNAVRSTTGRVLARSHTREFATVDRDRSPSPFLPVGVGDPRCSRFEMTFFEPIAAEIGALRLYFNVPPVPGSVRPEAFHLRRLNSGVEPILITKARVVPPADFSGFATDYGNVSFYGNVSLFPGSVVELLLGTRVTPGRDVYLSLDHGDDALRDYGGRKVERLSV